MTATAGAPVLSSAGVNVRPSAGWTPSTSKKLADTRAPGNCSGRSPSVALNRSFAIAARPLSIESRAASSTNAGYEKGPSTMARFGLEPERMNRRAGILERQRPQQRRVDDAEDGGVGADADRDDRDGDQRELARFQERSDRVSHS